MALDKALVLSQNTKQAAPKDALTARRNRLINRFHNLLEYLQREKEGQLPQRAYRRLARWWWQEGKQYFLSIQYYRLPMALAKGKYSVQYADLDAAANVLRAVEKAIAADDYDTVMIDQAERTKKNFGIL